MKDKIDFAVFIGRFQPFHKGHEQVVKNALHFAKHLIIVCGSSFIPRTPRNPWSFIERKEMILTCFPEYHGRISVIPLLDIPYNDEAWIWMLQKSISQVIKSQGVSDETKTAIGIIKPPFDHQPDYSSYFPQWQPLEIPASKHLRSTLIREKFFQPSIKYDEIQTWVSEPIMQVLKLFSSTKEYKALIEEQEFLAHYRKGWENAPYPPIFVTVDAVVCQSGHILMVKRRAYPGKNLLALPGGFVGQDESLITACLRELRSETKLKVPEPVLKGSLRSMKAFDYPYRSLRGRTITHAFYFELSREHKLPEVKGGQDAKQAFWLPLSQLDSTMIFEDHYSIIQDLLKIYMH